MGGAISPLPQYAFMTWCSIRKKHRGTTVIYLGSVYTAQLGSDNMPLKNVAGLQQTLRNV
jgi:hypothetical protein